MQAASPRSRSPARFLFSSRGVSVSSLPSSRISFRNRSPYFSSLNTPTPLICLSSSLVTGRTAAICSSVASEKITKGGTCSSLAICVRSLRSCSKRTPLSPVDFRLSITCSAAIRSIPTAGPITRPSPDRTRIAIGVRYREG